MSQASSIPTSLPREQAGNAIRHRTSRRKLSRIVLMLGGVGVVAIGGAYAWLTGGRYVSIDNAYTNADKVALSTDVSGLVLDIPVREGQEVHKGDVLFRLDPRQTRIAVEAAKADLEQTRLTLESMKRDYERMVRDTSVKSSQVQADQATYDRYAALVGKGDLSRSNFDDARYKLAANQRSVESSTLAAQVQLARLNGDAQVDVTTLPMYRQGQAKLDEAQRQLTDTVVRAPFDGIVTQVSTLQPGMFLPAGTSAFGLISTDHVWVDANPKETDLTWVQPGNPVQVAIDTYPGRVWTGTVDSISAGSGSQFSIIPAQNSSGNWVKVVQRIPLRVRVDRKPGDPPLRAGMSVIVDVDTGHKRTLHDLF
ncbi:HlyD family secretion protein [Acidisphaera sp. L21]|uniref:HlyD family secretion protein n=1 Tax=Acidisphaera sp. L21 TaxID=1641851 RepID=UPI00131EA65E|nr:HlyD family secretion protein [Acidisphaera sp. L21]